MMEIDLQMFGGRGGTSGGNGGNGSVGNSMKYNRSAEKYADLTDSEYSDAKRQIEKSAFEKTGNGVWEMTTSGKVGIGAQILDESDSRAGGYGRMKSYSVKTWGKDVGDVGETRYFSSLNAAKTAAREEMGGWLKGRKSSSQSASSSKNANKRISVGGKSFNVKNGVIRVSMYDLQSRITAIQKKAKENGWTVEYTR